MPALRRFIAQQSFNGVPHLLPTPALIQGIGEYRRHRLPLYLQVAQMRIADTDLSLHD
ncbi:hypothetical protein D3C71_2195220 [compost metagenome]